MLDLEPIDRKTGAGKPTAADAQVITKDNILVDNMKRNPKKAAEIEENHLYSQKYQIYNKTSKKDIDTNRGVYEEQMGILTAPIENFQEYLETARKRIKESKENLKEIQNPKTAEGILTSIQRLHYMADIKTVERALTSLPESDFYPALCKNQASNQNLRLPFEARYNWCIRQIANNITGFYGNKVRFGSAAGVHFPPLPTPLKNYNGDDIRDIRENLQNMQDFFQQFENALKYYESRHQSYNSPWEQTPPPLSEELFSDAKDNLGLVKVLNKVNSETFLNQFAAANSLTLENSKLQAKVKNKINLLFGQPRDDEEATRFFPDAEITSESDNYVFNFNTDKITIFEALTKVRELEGRLKSLCELEYKEDLINFYKAAEGAKGPDNKSESAAKYLTSFIYNYTVSHGMTTDPFRFPIDIAGIQKSPNLKMFTSIYEKFFKDKIVSTAKDNWENFKSKHQKIRAGDRQIELKSEQFVARNMIPKSVDGTMCYIACKKKDPETLIPQKTLIPIFKVSNFHVSSGIDPKDTSPESDRFTSIIASSTRSIKKRKETHEDLDTERHPEISTVYWSPRNDDFHDQPEISSFKLQFALIEQIPTEENGRSKYKIIDSEGHIKDLPSGLKVIPAVPFAREDVNKLIFEDLESQINQAFDGPNALFPSGLKVEINKTEVVDKDGHKSMRYSLNSTAGATAALAKWTGLEKTQIPDKIQFMSIDFPVQSN